MESCCALNSLLPSNMKRRSLPETWRSAVTQTKLLNAETHYRITIYKSTSSLPLFLLLQTLTIIILYPLSHSQPTIKPNSRLHHAFPLPPLNRIRNLQHCYPRSSPSESRSKHQTHHHNPSSFYPFPSLPPFLPPPYLYNLFIYPNNLTYPPQNQQLKPAPFGFSSEKYCSPLHCTSLIHSLFYAPPSNVWSPLETKLQRPEKPACGPQLQLE